MTITLSKDLEKIVNNAVRAGFYAREDDVIRDALTRLEQTMPKPARAASGRKAKNPKAAPQQHEKPITIAEIHQQMLASGLISQLPDPAQDIDDDDPDDLPVPIKGEPLSETIIRDRR
jgi:Arc/MetJ-type ribon-helix-helix transcriptional regulator